MEFSAHLHLCHHDPSGLLVEPLVVPIRINEGEPGGQSVVFPQPDRVEGSQAGLLVTAAVSCSEALLVPFLLSGRYLTLLPLQVALLLGQEPLAAPRHRVGLHQSACQLPQLPGVLLVRAVEVAPVVKVSDLVHLFPVAEGAAELRSRHGPDEVHTSLAVSAEEGIVLRDLYGETLRVEDQLADGL